MKRMKAGIKKGRKEVERADSKSGNIRMKRSITEEPTMLKQKMLMKRQITEEN